MNSDDETGLLSIAELLGSFLAVIALVSILSCCLSRRIITTRLPGVLRDQAVDRPITGSSVAADGGGEGDRNDAVEWALERFTKLEVVGGGGGGACSVCLGEYGPNDVVRVLPRCGHAFHRTCVDSWLRLRPTCPLCRNEPCAVVSSSLDDRSRVAASSPTVPPRG